MFTINSIRCEKPFLRVIYKSEARFERISVAEYDFFVILTRARSSSENSLKFFVCRFAYSFQEALKSACSKRHIGKNDRILPPFPARVKSGYSVRI